MEKKFSARYGDAATARRLRFTSRWTRDVGGVIHGYRVVVVGTHPELMDALIDLVAEEPALQFVGAARSNAEAIALAIAHEPELFLVDLDATDVKATQIAREINESLPGSRLVALSTYGDAGSVRRALDAGFHRHVNKGSELADLLPILLEDHVLPA